MDAQEISTLLGKSIFERAQKYRKRILQSSCTTNEDGVRHLTALVQGSGPDCYYTQVWLRENGSFVSASCDCPYNQNGDGTYCKHIGALLLQDAEKNPPAPEKKPESIPGVQRGVAAGRCRTKRPGSGSCAKQAGRHPGRYPRRSGPECRAAPEGQLCLRAGNAVRPQVAGRGAGDRL